MKNQARHSCHPVSRAVGILLAGLAGVQTLTPMAARAQTRDGPPANPTPQVVEVIAPAPLPGHGVDRATLPYNTQVIRRSTIDAAQAENLGDLMQRLLPGTQLNDIQGSPFQSDLTFRGFRASGLIGASQGLSVYLDGVRINEPFGDVVHWDLIPEFALDSVSLVPGANPAFGLNTLGGSIALRTANGRSAPGWRAQLSSGSFQRHRVDVSHGGVTAGGLDHFLSVGVFDEKGWRDDSPGRLGTVSARLGIDTPAGEVAAHVLLGRSTLVGNGLVPLYSFDQDAQRTPDLGSLRHQAVYTHPDRTRNRLTQLSLQWRRALDDTWLAEAVAYSRDSRRDTLNGDEAEEGSSAPASLNRTLTRQRGQGVSVALSGKGGAHRWQFGATADRARVNFEQTEQEGSFTPTRGVLGLADEEPELDAAVQGSSSLLGLYATDTWALRPDTHATVTLRANHARVSNTLSSVDDDTHAFEVHPRETFSYRSLNPAIGLTHRLAGGSTLFANVARNTRVPTVIELGCADPEEPCRLPAGLQADPYLKQVRSTSVEAGWRWGTLTGTGGSITVYRADNRDDILFRAVSVTGQSGYFHNFDRTRHQGIDLEWRWQSGPWSLGTSLSHLDATYQASGLLRVGERHVEVRPGMRIAGLPRQSAKVSIDWRPAAAWTLGADLMAVSRRVTAGNEDGHYENGEEETADFSMPGYALVHLRLSWRPPQLKGLEFTARVDNALDRRTSSYGALAETRFTATGAPAATPREAVFAAPGAPRAVFIGLRLKF